VTRAELATLFSAVTPEFTPLSRDLSLFIDRCIEHVEVDVFDNRRKADRSPVDFDES